MQTLKINIPDGFVIDKFNEQTGEVSFKPKAKLPPMQRIKTVNDVLIDNGLTQGDFAEQCNGLSPDEVAYRVLKLLAKSLNEGWTPDWNNGKYDKYYPWFYLDNNGGSSGFQFYVCADWRSFSTVGSRLCYKSSELAEYAGKQFIEVYKSFMTL